VARYVLFVYTRPLPGMEADYHRWYEEVHLAEVLAVSGFTEAQRYEVCDAVLAPVARPGEYLAAYTIETDDIDKTLAVFDAARPSMTTPPSLDLTSVSFQLVRMMG
jgi:hypothetical protein